MPACVIVNVCPSTVIVPVRDVVARQLAAIEEIINAFNELNPGKEIEIEGLPKYRDVVEKGIGAFLKPPPPPN